MPNPIDHEKTMELLYGKPKERVIINEIATKIADLPQDEKDASQIGCCGAFCSEALCCPYS